MDNNKNKNRSVIAFCILKLESKMQLGPYKEWKNRDFIFLSDAIYDKTRVRISTSTLKRLFGKIESKYLPNVSTLDAVAQFLDYKNWRNLITENSETYSDDYITEPDDIKTIEGISRPKVKVYLSITIVLLIGIVCSYIIFSQNKINKNDISFVCLNPNDSFPNSIKISYNIEKVYKNNVFMIVRGLGAKPDTFYLKKRDKNNTYFNFFLDFPGAYKTYLQINKDTFFQQKFFSYSNNWILVMESTQKGYYDNFIEYDSIISDGVLGVDYSKLKQWGYDENVKSVRYLISDPVFRKVNPDNFDVSLKVKVPSFQNSDRCRRAYISILGIDYFIAFALLNKGCSPSNNIFMPEKKINGETFDLEGLSVNINQWHEVKVSNKNDTFRIYIDSTQVFTDVLKHSIEEFGTLTVKFFGYGQIDDVSIKSRDSITIYTEDFN